MRGDRGTALVEHEVHRLLAHDFAHGRFGGLADGFIRIAGHEQVVGRAVGAQAVLDDELHVDDVLVRREHQRFGQDLVARAAAETDLERAQLRHVDHLVALDRIRHAPLEAGLGRALVFAELGHDGDLTFLHDVEAAGQPDADCDQSDDAQADARSTRRRRRHAAPVAGAIVAAPALAPEQGPDAIIEIAPDLVQIGRTVSVALRPLRRRLGAVIVPTTPAGVIQIEEFDNSRHCFPQSVRSPQLPRATRPNRRARWRLQILAQSYHVHRALPGVPIPPGQSCCIQEWWEWTPRRFPPALY
ncbi:hypothetical protein D9M68_643540 [compost metagenome]